MKRLLLAMLCLIVLTSCSLLTKTVVKTEYVYPAIPAVPAEPVYFQVQWSNVGGKYCLDVVNSKNLLKNVTLLRDNRAEIVEIIEGLRSIGTPTR